MKVATKATARHRAALAILLTTLAVLPVLQAQFEYPEASQVHKDGTAILLEDYASLPLSSATTDSYPPPINFHSQLGRANYLRSEPEDAPQAASRFFVVDSNANLLILDKSTKQFTPYIIFAEIFPKFDSSKGFASGIVSLAFDPGYARNGKFYTVHVEVPDKKGSAAPVNTHAPGLNLTGYTTTPTVNPPAGGVGFESVLVEWTDTDISDSKFEGTAREILRIGFGTYRHQMDDLLFNPTARPGLIDYGNLYVSVGDGQSGELPGPGHTTPQQLNALQGKILRITPDIHLRPKDELSPNRRYRIPSTGPDPNPFVSVRGARGELFAYGLRNPHRMSWDPVTSTLLVNDIGLHSWEEVNILTKGGNYGYAEREGLEQIFVGGPNDGKTATQIDPPIPFPATDQLTVDGLDKPVVPLYPVAMYSHREGDSIGSGFVYRGKFMPSLAGKYIFNDMPTGRLFYADLAEMIATHRMRRKPAEIHELQILFKNPNDGPNAVPAKRRMYDIVADAYAHKEGNPRPDSASSNEGVLPGASMNVGGWSGKLFVPGKPDPDGVAYGGGRADVRISEGGDGELYLLSKSDGMIRKMVAVVTRPSNSKESAGH